MKCVTNVEALEIELIKSKVSKKDLAKKLGISVQALYNKLNSSAEFKASEIQKTSEILNLSYEKREKIFFAHKVE